MFVCVCVDVCIQCVYLYWCVSVCMCGGEDGVCDVCVCVYALCVYVCVV